MLLTPWHTASPSKITITNSEKPKIARLHYFEPNYEYKKPRMTLKHQCLLYVLQRSVWCQLVRSTSTEHRSEKTLKIAID